MYLMSVYDKADFSTVDLSVLKEIVKISSEGLLRQGLFVSLKNLVNFAKNKNMTRILLTLSLICLIMTGCSSNNEPIEFEDEDSNQ